jgi:hypothetical protein
VIRQDAEMLDLVSEPIEIREDARAGRNLQLVLGAELQCIAEWLEMADSIGFVDFRRIAIRRLVQDREFHRCG